MALKGKWTDKVDGVDYVISKDINDIAHSVIEAEEAIEDIKEIGGGGSSGKDGVTFTPNVSSAGIISWTNNGGLDNPTPVNIKGDPGEKGDPYTLTETDKTAIAKKVGEEVITQNTGNSTEIVMSQKAVTDALKNLTTLPYGGSKEWLEANGDTAQLYQIDGYVWGYVESNGWTKSGTQFLVVSSESAMTNKGGTPYLLRSGDEGTAYSYTEASGDVGIPVYDTKPTTANEGDVIAVGGRKYKATITETQVPNFTDLAHNFEVGRLNSSGAVVSADEANTYTCIDYIPVITGTVVRIKGYGECISHNTSIYNNDKTIDASNKLNDLSYYGTYVYDSSSGIATFTYTKSGLTSASPRFMRFSSQVVGTTDDVIITVDKEITYKTETSVTWTDIGAYTPPVSAGWSATDETYDVIDSLSATANNGASAVYSVDGYLYSYIIGSAWVQTSKYNAPTLSIDGQLSDTSTNAVQNKVVTEALNEVKVKANGNASEITAIHERIANIETGSGTVAIPTWWQSAVDTCVAKIKTLQVGRNCVTFPFFSDNHTRDGKAQYMGILIAHVMKECGIPYCFYGGDAITSALASTADSDAEFKAQAKAFDAAMSYIPDGRFCMALGNHEGYLKQNTSIEGSITVTYDRNQTYDIFLRGEGTAQNKHFGGDGTYYYVDDIASKVRWIVLNTNGIGNDDLDSAQLLWFRDKALKFGESGWGVVIVSHFPVTRHHNASGGFTNNTTVISMLQNYMNGSDANKADIIGWYSGHIHRDRIYTGVSVNDTDDTEGAAMGFKQITITSDHTAIAYPVGNSPTTHPIDNSDKSHAIDFVTINKNTRTVNITRLGIGDDRSYTY